MKIGGLNRSVGQGSKVGCCLALDLKRKDGDSFMSDDVYGHLCTNYGSKWQLDGRYFDGVSTNRISVPHTTCLNLSEAITVEALVKTENVSVSGYGDIVSKANVGLGDGYWLYRDKAKLGVQINLAGWRTLTSDNAFVVGSFLYGSFTYDKQILILYAGGDNVARANYTSSITTNNYPLSIGYEPESAGNPFRGVIGRVKVFSQADYAARILSRSIGVR